MKKVSHTGTFFMSICVLTGILFVFLFSTSFINAKNINFAVPKSPINTGNAKGMQNQRTFAIVYPVLHPFFESVTSSAEKTAKELNCKLIVRGPDIDNFQIDQQIDIVNRLIDMKVDGIAIGPTDSKSLAPIIDKAINNGIKVICFDTDAPQSKRMSYIGTNNTEAGKHMGDVLAKFLNKKGKILCLTGVPSQLNLKQRIDGIKKVLKKYPAIKMIEIQSNLGDPSIAIKRIEEMINKHPDFNALIGIDSLSGPAAITVWKAKGLKKVVITFDNLPENLDGIRNGQITASISQNQYLWGDLVLRKLNDLCDKKNIPPHIYTTTSEINRNNIDNIK